MIGLPQIQAFLEVARCASFADASRRLSLPRSTVSARIRALEETLQVRLLQRTTRRVALTDEGRRYQERCEQAIEQLAQAHDDLSAGEPSGTVRITVPTDMPKAALSQVLGGFIDRHPTIDVEVTHTDTVLDLVANNLDVALRGNAPGADGLIARKLGECTVACFASASYVAEHLRTRELTDPSAHVIYDPLRRMQSSRGTRKQSGTVVTHSLELTKMMALQSRGIAVLPDNVCSQEVLSGSLVRLSCEQWLAPLPLYLVMPSRTHLPARVRAFIDFVTQPGVRASLLETP